MTGLTRILAIVTVILTAGRGVCAEEPGVDPKMPSPARRRFLVFNSLVAVPAPVEPLPPKGGRIRGE